MMERCSVWQWLTIEDGALADYARLKGFHYRGGPPGGVMRVFTARYRGPGLGGSLAERGMVAGVAVESLPSLGCALREVALAGRYGGADRKLSAAKLNREVRTISRVVVHPMFRSTGLAVELVKQVLSNARTPYVEALAAMGRVHPFFERAGMKAFDRPPRGEVVRLLAALEHEGFKPLDLVDPVRIRESALLRGELKRFCRKEGDFGEMVREARTRVLSQPVYYIWQRECSL